MWISLFELSKYFERKVGGVWASEAGRSGIKPLKWCHPLIEDEEKFWRKRNLEFVVQRKEIEFFSCKERIVKNQ